MLWFVSEPGEGGGDKLTGLVRDSKHYVPLHREFDYRITWDSDRELWRLDSRTHVDGG